MRRFRLPFLLSILAGLLILRVVVPTRSEKPTQAVAAARSTLAPTPTAIKAAAPPQEAVAARAPASADDQPGNAFAVRMLATPVPVASASIVVPVMALPRAQPAPMSSLPARDPSLPPVPFQVIGTWDDGKGLGVFVASPSGTQLARQGAVLLSEYKVMAVTPRQVSLMHIDSHREIRLVVPNAGRFLP